MRVMSVEVSTKASSWSEFVNHLKVTSQPEIKYLVFIFNACGMDRSDKDHIFLAK